MLARCVVVVKAWFSEESSGHVGSFGVTKVSPSKLRVSSI